MGTQGELAFIQANVSGLGKRVRALEEAREAAPRGGDRVESRVEALEERVQRLEGAPVRKRLTLREVAERLEISVDTVRRDIRAARLHVTNMRPPGMRPKYRVTEEAFELYAKGWLERSTGIMTTQ